MRTFNLRLSYDMNSRLRCLSHATKKPKTFFVTEALERSISDLEEKYLIGPMAERAQRLGLDADAVEYTLRDVGVGYPPIIIEIDK